jgi:hypothetical protein
MSDEHRASSPDSQQPIRAHLHDTHIARLWRDDSGDLALTISSGETFQNIRPVRSFPISEPDFGISLVAEDGHEILWIARLAACPEDIRELLGTELALTDFLPRITRVYSVSSSREPSEWDVETDRGRTRFVMRSEEDVRRFDARRAILIDAHGVQYLVPDLRTVDAATRRHLERYF